jgi:hypothetical protein
LASSPLTIEAFILNARPFDKFSALSFDRNTATLAGFYGDPSSSSSSSLAWPPRHSQKLEVASHGAPKAATPRLVLRVLTASPDAAHEATYATLPPLAERAMPWCPHGLHLTWDTIFARRLFFQYLDLFRFLLALRPDQDYFLVLEDDAIIGDLPGLLATVADVTQHQRPLFYSLFDPATLNPAGSAAPGFSPYFDQCFYDSGTTAFIIHRALIHRLLDDDAAGHFDRCNLPPIDLFLAHLVTYRTTQPLILHPRRSRRFFPPDLYHPDLHAFLDPDAMTSSSAIPSTTTRGADRQ